MTELRTTPLHALHLELGAKMVPFAGYDMPVQFEGVLAEHNHTRAAAGLFDVSHMGQAFLQGPDHETVARAVEAMTPGEIVKLGKGRVRYTLLLNSEGGILDDFMVTRPVDDNYDGWLFIVVNAARKHADFSHIDMEIPEGVVLKRAKDRALLALQGPKAAAVLARHAPAAADMTFMTAAEMPVAGIDGCIVTRSGYTGEDGFEISVPEDDAEKLARTLLAEDEVKPIGLGARDSLRLEAGLCLYGHDIDETTTPIEANLAFAIGKRRREEGGFPGAEKILKQLADGPSRLRVGIVPEGRAPAREGAEIVNGDGKVIGKITSGTFGPTFGGPVAMGYVDAAHAAEGTAVGLIVRGKTLPAKIAAMPFVPHRYYRKPN
jgi:aminomethyltransferase